jgi:hypothetical protein
MNFVKWFGGESTSIVPYSKIVTALTALPLDKAASVDDNRQYFLPLRVRKAGIHLLDDAIKLGDGRGTRVEHLQQFAFLEPISADGLQEPLDVRVRQGGARAGEEVVADLRRCVSS